MRFTSSILPLKAALCTGWFLAGPAGGQGREREKMREEGGNGEWKGGGKREGKGMKSLTQGQRVGGVLWERTER
jgi:hypothetical protein